jgi:hypothetical protein
MSGKEEAGADPASISRPHIPRHMPARKQGTPRASRYSRSSVAGTGGRVAWEPRTIMGFFALRRISAALET